MEALLVNAGGLLLMAAIIWWFWLAPSPGQAKESDQHHH